MKLLNKISVFLTLLVPFTGCRIEDNRIDEIKLSESIDRINNQDWNEVVNLNGSWNFSIGDNEEWINPDYDDKDWEKIRVPSSWENEGFHGYDGYAWYRKSFNLSSDFKDKNLYLHLGYIDDCDEVFINGNLVGVSGSFPPDYRTAYNAYRRYYIPSENLKTGKNIIAVRVYDSQLEGGILNGDIGIFSSKKVDMNIVLEGKWKFLIGDNKEWSSINHNDKDWESIYVPGFWEDQGFNDYNGYAWYRKEFNITKQLEEKSLVLILGKIDDLDEAYINGVRLGANGEINNSDRNLGDFYTKFRSYLIPNNLVKAGKKNVVAVRVYDGFRNGGIYEGPVGIITQDNFTRFWRSRNLF